MRRTLKTLSPCLVAFLLMLTVAFAGNAQELQKKLEGLKGISGIEKLESDHYAEKYLVRITQPVDHKDPAAGTFTQRVIVAHVGFDRPTILVTEGYGAAYALNPRYQEELSKLLDANMVFVEYRYFLESTPTPCNWEYLTAENSAYDLHNVNQTFRELYTLNRGVEDGRHEPFLRKVGTKKDRQKIEAFQIEILKHKDEIVPMLEKFCKDKKLEFRIPIAEVLDYCVLEYPFALWQWGTPTSVIPPLTSDAKTLFYHLVDISGPDYFAENQPNISFFVQAARELGYYGYDTKPFRKYLTIDSSRGYLNRIMLPKELVDKVEYRPELYHKVYDFLRDNDPKMIFIYGEVDPWSATRVPIFKGKVNEQVYIQPGGSHRARIGNMPEDMKEKILTQINKWLAE